MLNQMTFDEIRANWQAEDLTCNTQIGRNIRGNFCPSDINPRSIQNVDTITLIAIARNLSARAFFENGRRPKSLNMLSEMPSTEAFTKIVAAQEIVRNELNKRGVPLSVI